MSSIGPSSQETSNNHLETRDEIISISETGGIPDNFIIFSNDIPNVEQSISRLQTIMSRRGFRVCIHMNKTAEEMRYLISECFQSSHQQSQSVWLLFCAIGCHGYVLGTDGQPFYINSIYQLYHHESLAGKPKIILVDAHDKELPFSVSESQGSPINLGFCYLSSTSSALVSFSVDSSLLNILGNAFEDEQPKLAKICLNAVAKQLREEGADCIIKERLKNRYYI